MGTYIFLGDQGEVRSVIPYLLRKKRRLGVVVAYKVLHEAAGGICI